MIAKVKCAVCGQEFTCITDAHLRRHGTDIVRYRIMYPNNKTESENYRRKMSNIVAKLPSNRKKGIMARQRRVDEG